MDMEKPISNAYHVLLCSFYMAILLITSDAFASDKSFNGISSNEIQETRDKFENSDFEVLYDEARSAFSSRTEYYRLIVKIMEERKAEFNTIQNQRLQYLQSFRQMVDGDPKKAADDMEELYPKLTTDKMRFRVSLFIVNSSGYARDFNRALYYLNEAKTLLPSIKDHKRRNRYYFQAIYIYQELKQYELALDFLNILLASGGEPIKNDCFTRLTQIELLFRLKQLNSNSDELHTGLSVCLEKKKSLLSNLIKIVQIDLLLHEDQPVKALEVLNEMMPNVKENDISFTLEHIYRRYAKAHFELNDYNKAQEYALKVIAEHKTNEPSEDVAESYDILHLVSLENGRLQDALAFYKKFTKQQNINLNEDAENLLTFQLAKFRVTEKINEIEALNNQNELLRLEQKLTKENEQNNQLIIMLLMIMVLFLVLWMYRSNQVQKQLKEIAQIDALTRIANRRYFTEVANKHLKQSMQNKTPVSVLLFDLDKFKSINDTYGHGIGDWVLIETAKACKDSIRESDMIGRLGGEEFGILLPNCDRQQAVMIAEKCRKALLAIDTSDTEFKFTVSGSFGVSDIAESGFTLKDILHNCDEALYEAKHRGRNQVVEYPFEAQDSAVT